VSVTDTTERALLRGIIANPADDTPRLVYADWLDEHEQMVPCEVCVRKGQECPQHVSNNYAKRAELIRVQCELTRLPKCPAKHHPECKPPRGDVRCARCDWVASEFHDRQHHCLSRETVLLTADRRREWARVPCPQCECKGGWEDAVAYSQCGHCHGTGDATQREGCTPHFRRGFVERVEVPGLAWVFERVAVDCPECGETAPGDDPETGAHPQCVHCRGTGTDSTRTEWRVTPWALAVAGTHPVTEFVIGDREPWALAVAGTHPVTEFVIGDREPWAGSHYESRQWWWVNADREQPVDGVPESCLIPRPLMLAIPERYRSPSNRRAQFETEGEALSALATAAADVVRAAVLEAWAKEGRT